MAWTENRGNGRVRGCYRDRQGRKAHVPGTFTSKTAAMRAAASKENEVRNTPVHREKVLAHAERITFAEWWPEYQRGRKVEPATVKACEQVYTAHLAAAWDAWRMHDITRDDVQEWVNGLETTVTRNGRRRGEPLKPSTVARIYQVFSGCVNAAITGSPRLPYSPCQKIALPHIDPADERFLTDDEVTRLRAAAPNATARMFLDLAFDTGLRAGELLGLHRARVFVDATSPYLTVFEVLDDVIGEIKPYPKSGRKRSVPLTRDMAAALRRYMRENPVPPCSMRHRDGAPCAGELLFADECGGAWRNGRFRTRFWEPMIDAAGLGTLRRHDLRHSFASRLVQSGRIDLYAVQDLLGHASSRTTERYSHLGEAHWDRVTAVLGGVTDAPAPTTPSPAATEPGESVEGAATESAPNLPPTADETPDAKIINFGRRGRSAS